MKVLSIPVTCHGHYRPISDIEYSSYDNSGYIILSASKDGTAILRDGVTGDWIGSLLGHKGAVWCCKISSNSKLAFTGSGDFSAKVWDLENGDCLKTISHSHIVRSLDLSRDDSKMISADNQYYINLYDVNKSDSALIRRKVHNDIIRKIILQDNEQNILSISDDGQIVLSDIRVASKDPQIILSLKDKPMDFTIEEKSNFETFLLSVAYAKKVDGMLVDLRMPYQAHDVKTSIELESEVNSIDIQTFSDPITKQNETFIVCGCTSGEILMYKNWMNETLWSKEASQNLKECYKGHFGPVHRVKFSPQIHFKDFTLSIVASGSEDGTVRLWQTFPGEEFGLWKKIAK